MPYLILGLAVLVGVLLIGRWLLTVDPARLAQGVRWAAAIGGGTVAAVLLTRGRLDLLFWVLGGIVPFLVRWRAFMQRARTMMGPSPGQASEVTTGFLHMRLDHDSGAMEGEVLAGSQAGRRLADLPLAALLALRREVAGDEQSLALIEAYLDRLHGPDWRDAEGGGAGGSAGGAEPAGTMTRRQALEILGLEEGASAAAVREAHRRLMKLNHPDRGGSAFLAAQINRAKDVLLGGG